MSEIVIKKYPKLLHGGDYNPDQWLDCPEILEEDIRLMKKAGVNAVSLGIFAWAALEPEEGVYAFDWLEKMIDRLYSEGIYTVLATPTGAMPNWLTEKYEEVRQVTPEGVRHLPGKRHNYCPTSPIMREKTKAIDTALSKRFGRHPAVILWHISNEIGGNDHQSACWCPKCQAAFRQWLREKYGTLENLNHAWWTAFWSHTYTSWEQIHAPSPAGEPWLHGLNLDWRRFTTVQMRDFYREEVKAVRTYSTVPVTANMMGFFKDLDYPKFADDIDIISWDAYPEWHSEADDVNIAVWAAANHNIMRSMKKAPFLMMESTPSVTNWKKNNIQKRPGMHEVSSMQAIALGSLSVQYFQWRKSRGSMEKFHGAVVGHIDHGHTRVFKEVAALGEHLASVSDAVYHTCNKPEVAMIFDWENWWALEDCAGPKRGSEMHYVETFLSHYKPFWMMGIDVDMVDMDADLDGYKLIIAPMNYMYKDGYARKVREFVQKGGIYVTTYWSGLVDETDLCFIDQAPLQDVLGLWVEETDSPNEFYENEFEYDGQRYPAKDICDIVRTTGAQKLASYCSDYYEGRAALTKNSFGDGTAYYIASGSSEEFCIDFYTELIRKYEIHQAIPTELPYGVTVSKREAAAPGAKTLYFVQNFNPYEVTVMLDHPYHCLETDEMLGEFLEMKGYSCTVLY